MNLQNLFITTEDGYRLSTLYGVAEKPNSKNVIISAATGIKKEFYINFACFLIKHGYTVLLFDYRGIGGSAPQDLKKMKSFMHEWGSKDMNAVLNFAIFEKKLTDIIWIGHSVGAQLIGFLKNAQHIKQVLSVNSALGYWKYFPFPQRWLIWFLWKFISPAMIKIYGYGTLRKLGWGENLPPNMLREWRNWCLSKTYFRDSIRLVDRLDKFYAFRTPITAIYMSDDYIANDLTVPLMMDFFPNAPRVIRKLSSKQYTKEKVGHTGIFRKKFEDSLWPVLFREIEYGEIYPKDQINIKKQSL